MVNVVVKCICRQMEERNLFPTIDPLYVRVCVSERASKQYSKYPAFKSTTILESVCTILCVQLVQVFRVVHLCALRSVSISVSVMRG